VQFECFLFQCQLVFSCKQTLTCVTIRISVGETKFQSLGTQMRVTQRITISVGETKFQSPGTQMRVM
jgi:hypothetical protein